MIENTIPSGFIKLDELTSGFQKSDLIILAARPAMGKTCICLNIANYLVSKSNISVLLFSSDSYEELIKRLGLDNSINLNNVHSVKETINNLEEACFIIDDTQSFSLTNIENKSREIYSNNKIGLIIIDYLQLIKINKSDSIDCRNKEISKILKRLKLLAKELNVPILCQSQHPRELEKRKDKRPILSDFGEITSIEEIVDTIIFLYRDEYYNHSSNNNTEKAEITIAKHHNKFINETIYLNYDSKIRKYSNV